MFRSALQEPEQLALHLAAQSAVAGVPVQLPWHSPEQVDLHEAMHSPLASALAPPSVVPAEAVPLHFASQVPSHFPVQLPSQSNSAGFTVHWPVQSASQLPVQLTSGSFEQLVAQFACSSAEQAASKWMGVHWTSQPPETSHLAFASTLMLPQSAMLAARAGMAEVTEAHATAPRSAMERNSEELVMKEASWVRRRTS
jgi:hypothetical protein